MSKSVKSFSDLGLNINIVNVCQDFGYINPLPIQVKCIPYLLAGYDVLGRAHTGSGKTAAFILPILNNIDVKQIYTQSLIITPTRELAIQIGSVCFNFSKYIETINIVTVYGGQSYNIQLYPLKKGAHIIVGTPGRLLDHIRRGNINLSKLNTLIIDEADEMLRMGFIEDVKNIIDKIPIKRQIALFSATLPLAVRQISYKFLNNPKEVYVNSSSYVCSDIKQTYWLVRDISKHEALLRFLEIEDFDAVIVFVRTKEATLKISTILENCGYNSSALNGDMQQTIRSQILSRFRNGLLNILIATDVAARGLDVNRVNFVINYDMPFNTDSYIHRIGRTGRAGCIGKSLLFVERQEHRLFHNIKRYINVDIIAVKYPTRETLINRRLVKFSENISRQLCDKNLSIYRSLLSKVKLKQDISMENLAIVFFKMVLDNQVSALSIVEAIKNKLNYQQCDSQKIRDYKFNKSYIYDNNYLIHDIGKSQCKKKTFASSIALYHISVGRDHGIKVRHIINMLSNNKINIHRHEIGNIRLFSSYTMIELSRILPMNQMKLELSSLHIVKPINIKFLKYISSKT